MLRELIICTTFAVLMPLAPATAGLSTYTDRQAWFDDVGAVAEITTVGFDDFGLTTITDQYEHLGVIFTDGNDTTRPSSGVFPRDGWGLDGNPDITMEFDSPQHAIAVDYPGAIQFDLYSGDMLLDSAQFAPTGFDNFGGIWSWVSFDRVVLTDPLVAIATIDDLHFATIPAPSASVAFTFLIVLRSRIRRRSALT